MMIPSMFSSWRRSLGLVREFRKHGESLHLVVAVTTSKSLALLRGQLAAMKAHGFDVTLICSPAPAAEEFAHSEGVRLVAIPMQREISVIRDLASLYRVIVELKRLRPDVVNAGTPKAGLLLMLASVVTRVPGRIYTLRGLRLETKRGLSRLLIGVLERLCSECAHRTVCISPSLAQRAVELRLVRASRVVVLGSGSSNGIDLDRFRAEGEVRSVGDQLRARIGAVEGDFVLGFVGRLVADKGIAALENSWTRLRRDQPNPERHLHLVIAGECEAGDPLPDDLVDRLQRSSGVHMLGQLDDVRPVYAAIDLLVLPSLREGFGTVLLEAGAMEVPVVASRIPGCIDAVDDGVTGKLVPPGDDAALTTAINEYVANPPLGKEHGQRGRERAGRDFNQESLWQGLAKLYSSVFEAHAPER